MKWIKSEDFNKEEFNKLKAVPKIDDKKALGALEELQGANYGLEAAERTLSSDPRFAEAVKQMSAAYDMCFNARNIIEDIIGVNPK